MAFGLGKMPLAGDIWEARPKPMSALWGGTKGGAVGGAVAGTAVGGFPVGTAIGAAAGIALATVAASSGRLKERMDRLEETTRSLIEQYKAYSPAIARMRNQWMLLDRRLNRIWAETLAPLLKKLTDIGTEFRERWTRMKIDLFQAIEPLLKRVLDIFQKLGRATIWILEKFLKVIGAVIEGFTKLARFLHWLPEEETRGRTQALGSHPIEWPTIEGPLSGAMRRIGLTGPPFTTEKARRAPEEEKEIRLPFMVPPKEFWELKESDLRKGARPEVNVSVNVGDSKELSAAFERIWHEATYKLRQIETEEMYAAYKLQNEGTYA